MSSKYLLEAPNYSQKGNRLLKYIKNVGWEFGSVTADYAMGFDICALYLRYTKE
jgi:hypothetical protein